MIFGRAKKRPQTVFVGLSGGVDSSVAALRLKQQGFNVVGVFIKVWQPDFLECDSERDRLDAMRAAAHLGIPFMTLDAAEEYRREVGEYFVQEYKKGRTPNPDVMCNRHIKFGVFLRFARENGADFIATGHYAGLEKLGVTYQLYRGKDTQKDQSYFLWTLNQADLSHVLLPLGYTEKAKVREEARLAGLPTATRKDSQGICFLGHVDIPEFLKHFYELQTGPVTNVEGKVIGTHEGAIAYTLGQRHGFTITGVDTNSGPHYVVAKNLDTNTLVVDTSLPIAKTSRSIPLTKVNWISGEPPEQTELLAQFRYRQTPFMVELIEKGGRWRIKPKIEVEKPAPGQSAVFYDGEECVGGAVIGG